MALTKFKRTFAAAHRLWNDDSKCRNIHGHNYEVEIVIEMDGNWLTPQGFTVPFDLIKQVIDNFDHTLILHEEDPLLEVLGVGMDRDVLPGLRIMPYMPSTENMARMIASELWSAINPPKGPPVALHVWVHETSHISAHASYRTR